MRTGTSQVCLKVGPPPHQKSQKTTHDGVPVGFPCYSKKDIKMMSVFLLVSLVTPRNDNPSGGLFKDPVFASSKRTMSGQFGDKPTWLARTNPDLIPHEGHPLPTEMEHREAEASGAGSLCQRDGCIALERAWLVGAPPKLCCMPGDARVDYA